jgi:hypothetical protein
MYEEYRQYGMTEDEYFEMKWFHMQDVDAEEEREHGSKYLYEILEDTLDAHLALVDSTPRLVNGLLA